MSGISNTMKAMSPAYMVYDAISGRGKAAKKQQDAKRNRQQTPDSILSAATGRLGAMGAGSGLGLLNRYL